MGSPAVVVSAVVVSAAVVSGLEVGAVVVVAGDQGILDQPDGRGERPPGGRAAAHLPVGGQLEDGDEVRQRVRRGAADQDGIPEGRRAAKEGRARPAALGVRCPITHDADGALGHQKTLAVQQAVVWEPRRTTPEKAAGNRVDVSPWRYARNRSGCLSAGLGRGQPGCAAVRQASGSTRFACTRPWREYLRGTRPAWSGSTCRWACSIRAGARRTGPRAACSGPGAARSSRSRPGRSGPGQLSGRQPALPRADRPGFQHPGVGAEGQTARGRGVPRNLR